MPKAETANLFKVVSDPQLVSEDRTGIAELCEELAEYLEFEQVETVYRAYLVGARAHEGQSRVSGEPYISHPVAVARILAEMRMDCSSVVAAILHDVIEDTPTLKEDLAEEFGEEVAELVDGVSKLTKIDFRSKAEAQAENFRKMMLAMVKDIRVIIIKLADRLHNMRTLEAMRPDKRRRIARETMDIYAPIANRLGIFKMRHELLDLSISAAYPMRYRALASACKEVVGYRKEIFNTIEAAIRERLEHAGISATVKYRQKNIHSIYRKMKEKKLSFKALTDVFGVRIMTDSVDDCYRVLGVMHNLYKPLPGKFKDYLAIPKTNGYQSLHSSLFGPHGVAIEVQIRTENMDQFAESGIAAHWLYKEGENSTSTAQSRALEWLKNLLEMQQKSGSSLEFLESVKVDLFPDEIYVFTPKGDIKKLPRGSTVVDFAYAVHTDVGNTCVAARIDSRMSPLSSRLVNGQTIEIVCSDASRPHPSWLDFVITARARTNIRHFLKSLQTSEAISLGQRLLQQSVNQIVGREEAITNERFGRVLEQYRIDDQQHLLAEIGLGNRNSSLVAKAMYEIEDNETVFDDAGKPLAIRGTEGMVVSFAKCCRPVPGDAIVGFMSSGKGIVVHQQNCRNITETASETRQLPVQWSDHVEGEYLAYIRVQVANQRGVLANLSATIADMYSNIEHVNLTEKDGRISTMEFVITVNDRIHLARIMKKLRSLPVVNRIWRK
ncbi:MAG: bifunctional GTP diphosphokinase/guanosine-3',5'-bis pyrophosphate 3'-pyrophosphohydrolase [Gammaproteobacteria bacterium]|nr:bifunctional GTP diphosphokinase/guanosine-3',5'-bis pyrophosphate 3'-pyrophosphohydrolase [Gammaproteobacteria bacterium]